MYACIDVSVQCRLEANYAHQQELDMIPLMMQRDYKPQGWRKSQHTSSRSRNMVVVAFDMVDDSAGSGPNHGHEAVVSNVGRRGGR